jgi:hypothetical protein
MVGLAGQHSPDLTPYEVLRQTVRPLVARRPNHCWDDVPLSDLGEHWSMRSSAVSSALLPGWLE